MWTFGPGVDQTRSSWESILITQLTDSASFQKLVIITLTIVRVKKYSIGYIRKNKTFFQYHAYDLHNERLNINCIRDNEYYGTGKKLRCDIIFYQEPNAVTKKKRSSLLINNTFR